MNDARREVLRQRDRLNSTFGRISNIDQDATETRADFAKYLCVRVSGFLETSISALLKAYAVQQSGPKIAHFIAAELDRFQNAKKDKILMLFVQFDATWRADLETYLIDEEAAALGTIVANRHKIAHGEDSTLTYMRVKEHWQVVQRVVDHIADLVDPL